MTRTISLLSVLAVGCGNIDLGENEPDPGFEYSLVLDMLPAEVVDVDLLFVMDNSGSMAEEQASIAAWAEESLFGVLELDPDTMLNLHIGIVSTNLGVGPYSITGCPDGGDDGVLQNAPRVMDCSPPADRYIIDVDDGAGGRVTNYTGTLQDTFACIAQLGIDGCGFEHPLEAMRRALTHPDNAGFLRDDALLAVVVVSDEDDCSAFDPAVFDPADVSIDDPLGPMSSFRCFEFGVACAGDDPRTPGDKTGCVPRDDSAYLTRVSEYADFLHGLKDDPSMVVVAGIVGQPGETVGVVADANGNPTLVPACEAAGGVAFPAVRLQAFFDAFPERNRVASVCSDSMSGPLAMAARHVRDTALRQPCLHGALQDLSAHDTGMQPACRAYEQLGDARTEIAPCDGGAGACYALVEDPVGCGHTETTLAVELRGTTPAPGAHVIVECAVP